MAETTNTKTMPEPTQRQLSELTRRGDEIYRPMQSQLEKEHSGKFIAIHVDSADYAIGNTSGDAGRSLLDRHPIDGRIHIRRIGGEPEHGLAARLGPEPISSASNS